MKQALVLALDMGTSSVRAMLFDTRGRALPGLEAQTAYAQRTTADGGVEMDAEVLLMTTVNCLRQLLRQTDPPTRTRIAGVGVSCFWHSLVGVEENGQATTPVLSWADTRSQSQAQALRETVDASRYHARTGCELHTSFWPAKLRWLRETQSDVFAKTDRWLSFGEYLFRRLFGPAANSLSLSMASGTGLLDPNAQAWDAETLAWLSLTVDRLNPLGSPDAAHGLLPEFAHALAPLQDVPWFPAVGDGACSNIGSGGVAQDRIALNVGTSGAMRVAVEADHAEVRPGLFCYRVDRRRFLFGGAFAGGGNVSAWQHETVRLPTSAVATRRLALMPPDGHGLTVLPFWAGERSPGWHVGARATLTGMNLHTTPLDLLRASLEAVTYTFADVLDRLHSAYPMAQEIVASGGAVAHNPAWMQIMADVFGSPVTLSRVAEASSRGAALMALDALGLIKELGHAPLYRGRTFRPNPRHAEIYAKARARYQTLYDRMLTP